MRVETEYEVEGSSDNCGVLWLGSPDCNEFVVDVKKECEMELVGGKAFNVSKLARKGFPTPEGFVITTGAYDYFLEFNGISREGERTCKRIREGVMPPDLGEVIKDAYHRYLEDTSCAVRSSSPFEDMKSASFAGQYKSLLNVKEGDALLDAVKDCWASLWGQRAVEYRKKIGVESENIRMAVLVQKMVEANASGVLFTEDQIVIEAVWGLADILVAGETLPDRFLVKRDGLSITERDISHKTMMSCPGMRGLGKIEVPDALRDNPVLGDDQIRRLCVLAMKVEDLFGCPQDIEWALSDHGFVLLQARPISVRHDEPVWSRANLAETQPGYVSYLSRIPENRPDFFVLGVRPLLECFGIADIPEDLKLTDYIYGHIYVNMKAVHETLGRIPGLSPDLLDRSMGHPSEENSQESKPGISAIVRLLPGALRIVRFFSNLPAEAEQVVPLSNEFIRDIRTSDLKKLSLRELDKLVWEMYDRTADIFRVHACTALANASIFGILQKMLRRTGEDGTENLLTIGLKGMSSSQLGIQMWKLTQEAKKSEKVVEIIFSKKEDMIDRLGQFPEGAIFLREFEKSMEEIGDRCSQELELSVPRWEENPHFVLSILANYLDSDANPMRTMEKQREMRAQATERILKRLSKNPLEKLIFEKILHKSQEYIVTRENLKTTWVRGVSAMRVLYLAISDKLVSSSVLKEREDIFFLKMTEVSDIIEGKFELHRLDDLLRERRTERKECEHLCVPEVIVGQPLPVSELKSTVEPKQILQGTGCSLGIVTGKARVANDPSECPDLKEGEILVAPVTDPGWTPLFIIAGGLVMELGGTLSHAVIIAREYGIPVVVGAKDATKIIRTGQLITVDGKKGTVYISE